MLNTRSILRKSGNSKKSRITPFTVVIKLIITEEEKEKIGNLRTSIDQYQFSQVNHEMIKHKWRSEYLPENKEIRIDDKLIF